MPRKAHMSRQTQVLLASLLEQPRTWQHGYALSIETGLKSGTLYPVLMRLNDQGYLASKWEDAEQTGRLPRHVYKLTPKGLALARERTRRDTRFEAISRPARVRA